MKLKVSFLTFLFFLLLLPSCGFFGTKDNSDDASENLSLAMTATCPNERLVAFEKEFHPWARNHCKGCHGVSTDPMFAAQNSTQAYIVGVKLLMKTFPDTSRYVDRAQDGHCGSQCQLNPTDLIRYLTNWATEEKSIDSTCTEVADPGTMPQGVEGKYFVDNVVDRLDGECFGCHGGRTSPAFLDGTLLEVYNKTLVQLQVGVGETANNLYKNVSGPHKGTSTCGPTQDFCKQIIEWYRLEVANP